TAGSLSLPGFLCQRRAEAATAKPARDTAVIQLWLGGGPSHLDMYDLKPAAPSEVRGPYRPITTNVPGIDLCELLPRQARLMDRLAVVRSLHHLTDEHPAGMHWIVTGNPNPAFGDSNPQPSHPAAGSIVARLRGANRP